MVIVVLKRSFSNIMLFVFFLKKEIGSSEKSKNFSFAPYVSIFENVFSEEDKS